MCEFYVRVFSRIVIIHFDFCTGELMIRTVLHQELPWEDYVKSLLTPPYNKLSIEKMLTKRIEFHGADDDKSVSGLIKLSDGNVMSLPGSLQPDERRMLEMLFRLIQEDSADDVEMTKNAMNVMKIAQMQ